MFQHLYKFSLTNTCLKGVFVNILSRNELYILFCAGAEAMHLLFAIVGAKYHYADA